VSHITLKRAIGLVLFVSITYSIVMVKPYKVMTNSMADVIQPKDYVLIYKNKSNGDFEKGDIVAFHKSVEDSITFIKRIAAVPGDTIHAYRYELVIADRTIPHDPIFEMLVTTDEDNEMDYSSRRYFEFLIQQMDRKDSLILQYSNIIESGNGLVVPDGVFFMVGDNAYESMDSRFWGFIPKEQVLGEVFAIF
tara:strand:- start:7956 stop:8534 length:579 start_codon:yes stop_codon:yes gene_type:complete